MKTFVVASNHPESLKLAAMWGGGFEASSSPGAGWGSGTLAQPLPPPLSSCHRAVVFSEG